MNPTFCFVLGKILFFLKLNSYTFELKQSNRITHTPPLNTTYGCMWNSCKFEFCLLECIWLIGHSVDWSLDNKYSTVVQNVLLIIRCKADVFCICCLFRFSSLWHFLNAYKIQKPLIIKTNYPSCIHDMN